jgi:hypothetical protein
VKRVVAGAAVYEEVCEAVGGVQGVVAVLAF